MSRQILADTLLLVEGRDEESLFAALIDRHLGADSEIQIIGAGGVDKFPVNLDAIRTAAQARPTLRSIVVVRDADDDADSAFRSVCGHLHDVGYLPPAAHGELSDAIPSIGVFVVPDGFSPGALETLCRRSVDGTHAAGCVDEYFACLERHDAMLSRNTDKSFAHANLASMRDPLARVGEGARSGVRNLESPAFAALSRFLRDLASQNA